MPTISTELLKKTFTTTPTALSPAIVSFCREISPDHVASRVPVRPDANAIPNECFHNVTARVSLEGGTIIYGWAIWEWPRVLIEAEHHAVWEKNGVVLDITPHSMQEAQIVFDPGRVYDFAGKKRVINLKRSLGELESVDNWIRAADVVHQAMEANSVGNEVRMNRAQLGALVENLRNAQAAMMLDLARNTRANAPCFCRSGKKFKKCCSQLIDFG